MESMPQSRKEERDMLQDCDICREEHGDRIPAVKYCRDCKEAMCGHCAKYHQRYKTGSGHRLIDIKDASVEDRRIQDVLIKLIKCPNHPSREVEMYCKTHKEVVCLMCVLQNHLKPCDTAELSNFNTGDAEFGGQWDKLAWKLRDALDRLHFLQKLTHENKNHLTQQLDDVRETVQQVKGQVTTLMDKIVTHVANVTKQIELEYKASLDVDVNRVTELKQVVELHVADLDLLAEHGSGRHKFVQTQQIRTKVEEIETQLSYEEQAMKKLDVELKLADDLRQLIENPDIDKLVQVTIGDYDKSHSQEHASDQLRDDDARTDQQEGSHPMAWEESAVPNSLRDSTLEKAEEHVVRPNGDHSPSYCGISMHKDGRIILCDNCTNVDCGYLCLYNPKNRSMKKLKMNKPYSATSLDDTHIAVSIPRDKAISIVSVGKELSLKKTLTTKYTPTSMKALSNGQVVVSWVDKGISFCTINIGGSDIVEHMHHEKYNLRGTEIDVNFDSLQCFAVDEKRCQLIAYRNCFDYKGKHKFHFSTTGRQQGVALDKSGNIYCTTYTGRTLKSDPKGSIDKFSPSGELIISISDDVPSHPQAICSNSSGTGFWVVHGRYDTVYTNDKILYFKLK